ncbi:MAG: chorismate synthase, partial [Nitrospinota bacterium]
GRALGATVDGCPAGLPLCEEDLQRELDRRRPGQSRATTRRREPDRVQILSGVFEGKTTGAPISLLIENVAVDSAPYEAIRELFRPSHGDYTYWVKYGHRDYRGGGRASARETVARVAAGAIAKKLLRLEGVEVFAFTAQVGSIVYEEERFSREAIENNPIRCPEPASARRMLSAIEEAKGRGDSLGGVVEVRATGVPPGLGEPVFDKLDADLAKALVSIGAVKGVEFGEGFRFSAMRGSEANDRFIFREGRVQTETNRSGGVLAGISTGAEIRIRLAVKPTPSIASPQVTVSLEGKETLIRIEGRHDPCICPRIVPVAEAMTALVLVDHWLRSTGNRLKS